jgi:hypothetical protein
VEAVHRPINLATDPFFRLQSRPSQLPRHPGIHTGLPECKRLLDDTAATPAGAVPPLVAAVNGGSDSRWVAVYPL